MNMAEAAPLNVDGVLHNENTYDPISYSKDEEDVYNTNSMNQSLHNLNQETSRLRALEEEQEILTSSLFSLTTHFAQVQFRLHQIVEAPPSERENLLKSLEEFAFRGVNKIGFDTVDTTVTEDISPKEKSILREQELINLLKTELQEVENYAYATGSAGIPQSVLIERQKVIIDELKNQINLNVDEIDQATLSTEELRHQVDCAIGQLVGPLKMKDALVNQLKTQIQDLERFIQFLQESPDTRWDNTKIFKSKHLNRSVNSDQKMLTVYNQRDDEIYCDKKMQSHTVGIMKKAAEFIQMFTSNQFGCDDYEFNENRLRKTKLNHWGDHRAQLEVAVEEILLLVEQSKIDTNDDYDIKTEYFKESDEASPEKYDIKLTTVVRKHLAICIRNLMQHGLMPIGQSTNIVPFFGCFSLRGQTVPKFMHAWEIILKYYHLKNGDLYNATPARCLSQSFNLSIVIGSPTSNKLTLLGAIAGIIADHNPYKCSYDSQFKAFICAALNANKLVQWLKLIFQCKNLINMHYATWSYVMKTGFVDSLQCLDKLTKHSFDLPVDLAVRKFHNIKDVFM